MPPTGIGTEYHTTKKMCAGHTLPVLLRAALPSTPTLVTITHILSLSYCPCSRIPLVTSVTADWGSLEQARSLACIQRTGASRSVKRISHKRPSAQGMRNCLRQKRSVLGTPRRPYPANTWLSARPQDAPLFTKIVPYSLRRWYFV